MLASEADEQRYLNAVDYRGAGALDGALLPALRQVLARDEPRQFIVLHMLGSHLHYAHRYPPAFEHFKPALAPDARPDIWRDAQREALTNAYDNSVRYTDEVLARVIETLGAAAAPGQPSIVASLTYVVGAAKLPSRCPETTFG